MEKPQVRGSLIHACAFVYTVTTQALAAAARRVRLVLSAIPAQGDAARANTDGACGDGNRDLRGRGLGGQTKTKFYRQMCSQVAGGGTCWAREGNRAYRWTDGEGGGDGGCKVKTGTCRRDGLGGEMVEIPLLPGDNWAACRCAARV